MKNPFKPPTDPNIDVSVVVCTRDREGPLDRLLASFSEMRAPERATWEVIVVDNGSTDGTPGVIARYSSVLPVRRVMEATPGLSHARNRAVANARGEYIVWTDDDVLVDPNWLAAYCEAFKRHPRAAFFGGKVEPVLQAPTPFWFRANIDLLAELTARRDLQPNETQFSLADGRLPFGANFAVRSRDQRRFPYDPNLGVAPNAKRSGEETDVLWLLLKNGHTGWWIPDAKVKHMFPSQRQSGAYIVDHYNALGQSWAYLNELRGDNCIGPAVETRRTLGGVPLWAYRGAVGGFARAACTRPFSRREWITHLKRFGYCLGVIEYYRTLSNSERI